MSPKSDRTYCMRSRMGVAARPMTHQPVAVAQYCNLSKVEWSTFYVRERWPRGSSSWLNRPRDRSDKCMQVW